MLRKQQKSYFRSMLQDPVEYMLQSTSNSTMKVPNAVDYRTEALMEEQIITFDEALMKHIGQFGRGQWRAVGLTSLFQVLNAFAFMLWVFLCVDPVDNHSWECTNPADETCQAVWHVDSPTQQELCSLSSAAWRWTKQDSLISRFNLVCSDAWKVQITNSMFFVGSFIGSGLFGALCDSFGRRLPLFISTAVISASMFVSLAAPNYWSMAAIRAVTGLGAAGQSSCIFLLCAEVTGPAFRGRVTIASLMLFTVGEFLLVALGFVLPNWKHLTIAAGAFNAAALLLFPAIPESARWLLSKGCQEEATALLSQIAASNGSCMPLHPLVCSRSSLSSDSLSSSDSSMHSATSITVATVSGSSNSSAAGSAGRLRSQSSDSASNDNGQLPRLRDLLRNPTLLRRSLILALTWYSLNQVYYGISLGAGSLPGSVYVTFTMGTAAETFALLVAGPSVDKVGRHNVVSFGLLLGGAACLACANTNGGILQAILAAIGKFGCSAASATIGIYTAELYPTSIRANTMGIFNQASRVGSIAAPFMLMLGAQLRVISPVFIPYMVFGVLSCISGLMVLLLPETLGAPMPESMADLQQLQSVFAAQPWKQGGGCLAVLRYIVRTRAGPVHASAALTRSKCSICISSAAAGSAGVEGDVHSQHDVLPFSCGHESAHKADVRKCSNTQTSAVVVQPHGGKHAASLMQEVVVQIVLPTASGVKQGAGSS